VSDNTIKTENRWRLSKIHGVVTSKSEKPSTHGLHIVEPVQFSSEQIYRMKSLYRMYQHKRITFKRKQHRKIAKLQKARILLSHSTLITCSQIILY